MYLFALYNQFDFRLLLSYLAGSYIGNISHNFAQGRSVDDLVVVDEDDADGDDDCGRDGRGDGHEGDDDDV